MTAPRFSRRGFLFDRYQRIDVREKEWKQEVLVKVLEWKRQKGDRRNITEQRRPRRRDNVRAGTPVRADRKPQKDHNVCPSTAGSPCLHRQAPGQHGAYRGTKTPGRRTGAPACRRSDRTSRRTARQKMQRPPARRWPGTKPCTICSGNAA